MKQTQLKSPFGKLLLTFRDTANVVVTLDRATPCEVNKVPLYFETYYKLEGDTWKAETGYQSFHVVDRWQKEVSKTTREKVHQRVIECLTTFVKAQALFMLSVKLDALKTKIEVAHSKQSSNLQEIAKLQDENLTLQSSIAGWMVQIEESREGFKSKAKQA